MAELLNGERTLPFVLKCFEKQRAAAKIPNAVSYINMKVMIGRVSVYGMCDSSRQ